MLCANLSLFFATFLLLYLKQYITLKKTCNTVSLTLMGWLSLFIILHQYIRTHFIGGALETCMLLIWEVRTKWQYIMKKIVTQPATSFLTHISASNRVWNFIMAIMDAIIKNLLIDIRLGYVVDIQLILLKENLHLQSKWIARYFYGNKLHKKS